jgi:dolichol-phosphate mannosyltransferase
MKLSLVIPARNEESCLEATLRELHGELTREGIPHEILVVDDGSQDGTPDILRRLASEIDEVRSISNKGPNGFGLAVRLGLERCAGDAAAVVMADGSDFPKDVVRFYRKLLEGYDCVFGTRFARGGRVIDYPRFKLILNRMFNLFIRILFGLAYNDVTNAFKMYRKETLSGLKPFLSNHFNLTVELPLKAIIRGYRYTVIPNGWRNRKGGESKLMIKEMGSRYMFIVLYCLIEKWLSKGDYRVAKGADRPSDSP